jgi:tetratricopeptide (TPR) repeat protein
MPLRHVLLAVTVWGLVRVNAGAYPPDPIREARDLMAQKKFDEAAQWLESYLASNRFYGPAWSAYSVALYSAKHHDRAIEASKKAIELGFSPAEQTYNIACNHSLAGRPDDAIAWLRKAFDAGFCDQETLEKDDDLDRLRQDSRFIELTGLNPPAGLSAEKQWAWDLNFLARRMEQMHWNLYAKVSKEGFRAELRQLQSDAPGLSPQRVRVRLARLLARVGDGHTMPAAFAEGEDTLFRIPLDLHLFTDGLFVIGAPERHRDLVGARVLRVGPLEADEAVERLRAFCSADNDMTYRIRLSSRLTWPAALEEIGAATGDDVEYTLRLADGSTRPVTLSPAAVGRAEWNRPAFSRPGFVYAGAGSASGLPLYRQELDRPLVLKSLDGQKAVYFGFHAVADTKDQTFASFVESLTRLIREKGARYLVIDMRMNGGGNTGLVLPLVHALVRNDEVNRPGHLFVIIGPHTFSAAQNTASLLELHTHATFVGEPTGSRPNFVGESTYFVLPYSRIRVYCSSRYWQHVTSTDRRVWIAPQIAVEMSFRDFAENRDPCLEAIFKRIQAGT